MKSLLLAVLLGTSGDRLRGEWPSTTQTIDVDLNATVAEALQAITKKAGWSLVVSAPSLDQKITIRSAKRPVTEVLTVVLEAANLMARLEGQTLIVKAFEAKTDEEIERDDEERERREDERQEREDRKRDMDDIPMPPMPPVPPMPPLPSMPGIVRDKESVTAMGQDLTIVKEEVVDDAVVSGADLIVFGRIRGDAVAMGGDVILKEGCVVEGDATAVGGTVRIEKGAILKGDKNDMARPFGGLIKRFAKSTIKSREHREHSERAGDDDGGFGWFAVFAKLFAAVAAFVIGVIVMGFAPDRVRRVKDILREKPIQSTAAGFATLLGFLPFCLLLVVTLVGIALVPLAFVVLALAYVVGYVALGLWIGERVWRSNTQERPTPLAYMSIGLGLLTVLSLIPWVGPIVVFLAATLATGAVLISRAGAAPDRPSDSPAL